jgi:anti-sigma factor RsiW
MNCADLEILLCDYIDGTLAADARAELELHLAGCANCAEMARDVSAAVGFMGRAADIEPPPELLTRILFNLPSAHHARAQQTGGLRNFLRRWIQPILQPRFAMGFAMTILSFSLLGRYAGISPRQLTLDDLRPAKVWQAIDDRASRVWQRTAKFYENLRFVYEIQTQLREWKQREQELRGRVAGEERPAPRNSRTGATPAPRTPGANGSQK